ncbi:ABC transporter ATP-binding protein [Gracilibacillus dipsosauri]|uniref:ABC transporter ATP-binding protein n=1 Tax=Gracilibacillus dipsosauri TaxID=178340 RepID=A0A317L351_9BACI|nr:ABC transporter ATP-binding protein [Gracilibacillus dipsosauri]PWU68219.1 ABC transporter ATP-binding protein [Gracilibacillus dipsosauri]
MSIIQIDNVSHQFGKEKVLKDVDLKIEKGKIYGLLGPSGAGKTTLINMIVGMLRPTKGTIIVDNTKVPSFKVLHKIGFMAQSDALYQELTAWENMEFIGSIYQVKKKILQKKMKEAARAVNLENHLKKPISQFSGGMKRRLSLAISLLHEPRILLLDEPTVGIDPLLRKSIWDEFRKLQQNGVTIVVTTHVMDEADKCDQLALLRDGRIVASGTPLELKKQYQVETIEDVFLKDGGVL